MLTPEVLPFTASVINIDPVVSGKRIGTSLLIEAGSQHLHEKQAYACRIYRFNDYEYRCRVAVSCPTVVGKAASPLPRPHDQFRTGRWFRRCSEPASHRGRTPPRRTQGTKHRPPHTTSIAPRSAPRCFRSRASSGYPFPHRTCLVDGIYVTYVATCCTCLPKLRQHHVWTFSNF